MKNSVIRLTVALITFTVGVLPVMVWHKLTRDPFDAWMEEACSQQREPCASPPPAVPHADRPGEEGLLPVLAYCELVGNPERHDGQVVRVRATMSLSIHGLFFSDVACGGYDQPTAVRLQASPGAKLAAHTPVELIVVGRFEKVTPSMETDSLLDTAPRQFEIMRVEKAAHNLSGRPAQPTSSRN